MDFFFRASQLAKGDTPQPLGRKFTQISIGDPLNGFVLEGGSVMVDSEPHVCGLDTEGSVECWG